MNLFFVSIQSYHHFDVYYWDQWWVYVYIYGTQIHVQPAYTRWSTHYSAKFINESRYNSILYTMAALQATIGILQKQTTSVAWAQTHVLMHWVIEQVRVMGARSREREAVIKLYYYIISFICTYSLYILCGHILCP